MKEQLTQSRLKELLHYDPVRGVFTNKVDRSNRKAGELAGSYDSHGYIIIKIDRRAYKAHRLVFLWMTGVFPEHEVDHINGTHDDNRWSNLRDVPRKENQHNLGGPKKTNKARLLGVNLDVRTGNWRARIEENGRQIHLGHHQTAELAHAAYLKAKDELHPTHRRLRGTV